MVDSDRMESTVHFDTDDPEFSRGFEIGILWERLSSDGACHMAVSAANAEMVLRVAKAFDCVFSGHELADDMISVELTRVSTDS